MTNEMTLSSKSDHINYAIGARLKSAREAMGFNQKDVANQLRLHEKLISMMENDTYPDDLPAIFVRGYIRSYCKFVELPDHVIKETLKTAQPPVMQAAEAEIKPEAKAKPMFDSAIERPARQFALSESSKKLIMRSLTWGIGFTLAGLLWMWWHNHTSSTLTMRTPEQAATTIPFDMGAPTAAHESATQTTSQAPVQTGTANSGSIKIPLAPQVNNALSSSATKPVATSDASAANKAQTTNDESTSEEE